MLVYIYKMVVTSFLIFWTLKILQKDRKYIANTCFHVYIFYQLLSVITIDQILNIQNYPTYENNHIIRISAGYFLSEFFEVYYEYSRDTLAHCIICSLPFVFLSFHSNLQIYCIVLLLSEISSPNVTILNFMRKNKLQKYKRIYAFNGVVLLVNFFIFRILLGTFIYYKLMFVEQKSLVSILLRIFNTIFMTLNTYWFTLILRGAIKACSSKNNYIN